MSRFSAWATAAVLSCTLAWPVATFSCAFNGMLPAWIVSAFLRCGALLGALVALLIHCARRAQPGADRGAAVALACLAFLFVVPDLEEAGLDAALAHAGPREVVAECRDLIARRTRLRSPLVDRADLPPALARLHVGLAFVHADHVVLQKFGVGDPAGYVVRLPGAPLPGRVVGEGISWCPARQFPAHGVD